MSGNLSRENDERLERVESALRRLSRENRRLKALLLAGMCLVIAGAALQDRDLSVRAITAQELLIKGADGTTRAHLRNDPQHWALLTLHHKDGKLGMRLGVRDDGLVYAYHLYPSEKLSFGWVTGPGESASFALRQADGKVAVGLTRVKPDEPFALTILDQGQPIAQLGGRKP